jgi:glycosyltransferase involved in cell wall biosynthesis
MAALAVATRIITMPKLLPGLGRTALEAAACGTPVNMVARGCGAYRCPPDVVKGGASGFARAPGVRPHG